MHHAPGDAVGPAQQALGVLEFARGERLAHRGGRGALAGHFDRGQEFGVEAERLAGLLQQGKIARAFGAVAEIVAHQHVARLQRAAQHLLDEGLGGERRKRAVETEHVQPVDPLPLQALGFFAQAGQARGRLLGREEFARVRLEAQHAARQAARPRHVLQAGEHGLVPEVQAVEVADGDRVGRAEGSEAVGDAHGVRCESGREKRSF